MGENLGRGGQLFSFTAGWGKRSNNTHTHIRRRSTRFRPLNASSAAAAHPRCLQLWPRPCSADPAPSAPARPLSSPAPAAVWPGWPDQRRPAPAGGNMKQTAAAEVVHLYIFQDLVKASITWDLCHCGFLCVNQELNSNIPSTLLRVTNSSMCIATVSFKS